MGWFVALPLFAQAAPSTPAPPPEAAPGSAVPWVLAFLFTVAILAIVCMPSRKA